MRARDGAGVADVEIDFEGIESELIANRRLFHAHAESGFTEFWTASRIALALRDLGYALSIGRDIMVPESRMGAPSPRTLSECRDRALAEGADPGFVSRMEDGYTAVAGSLANGNGPVIGFRFDMDAVDVGESENPDHVPRKEGFASMHPGVMHACGHDGHVSIGLALARLLAENRGAWRGTVKLVFQPAEEGVRGAKCIADSGFLDDVRYMIAGHLGIVPDGEDTLFCGVGSFLPTTKLDVHFQGVSAHAGMNPEKGRNAVLAAASAALHISGIPRHSGGATRVNIGRIEGGGGRNVVPDTAFLALETRGATSELNEYMEGEVVRIVEGVGTVYGVETRIVKMGEAQDARSDGALMEKAAECATEAGYSTVVRESVPLGGSEDFSFMMNRVERCGGTSLYVLFGTVLSDLHHNSRFDFRENDLIKAARLLYLLAANLGS